jgi:hypothetical protein
MKIKCLVLLASILAISCHAQWQHQTSDIGSPPVKSFGVNGTVIYSGTYSRLFYSANQGNLWENSWYGFGHSVPANILAIASAAGIPCILGTDQGLVYGYGNTLNEWLHYVGIPWDIQVYAIVKAGSGIFIGSQSGLYFSGDEGATYNLCPDIPASRTVYTIAEGENFLCAGTGEGIYLSADNGLTWNAVNNGLALSAGSVVQALTISGTNIFAGTSLDGLYISNNLGSNWTAINSGLTSANILSLTAVGAKVFAGTDNGVFLLEGTDNSWSDVSGDLANLPVNALLVNGDRIFAGTQNGIWMRPLSEFPSGIAPAEYLITVTVSPNPATDHISIEINRSAAHQDLAASVLNVNGLMLFRQMLQQMKTEIDIAYLAKGFYFLKIETTGNNTVVKFIKE